MKIAEMMLLLEIAVDGAEVDLDGGINHERADTLVGEGLIYGNDRFTLTERGRFYVGMILRVPLPKQKWVDPSETS